MSQVKSDERSETFAGLQCPLPLRDYPNVIMGHGGGGKLSSELIEQVFLPAFGTDARHGLPDSTVLQLPGTRIAMTTDSFVVQPLFFPGGSIGDLAINGTVNDLAMSGARPLYMTAGFILEEGFSIDSLIRIVQDMATAAETAGVKIVAGDTKVVERGHGDGCYINTAGVGLVGPEVCIAPHLAQPGDVVIVSGTLGDHGMAIMSVRENLEFEAPIASDTAALNGLVESMLAACPRIKVLRDPTRGGLAASLNEIAAASRCGMVLHEHQIPVNSAVQSACEILGLDPLLVANEGKLVAIVAASDAELVLSTMRQHPLGCQATVIGNVIADPHRMVVVKTAVGAARIVTIPIGEQLPRIC